MKVEDLAGELYRARYPYPNDGHDRSAYYGRWLDVAKKAIELLQPTKAEVRPRVKVRVGQVWECPSEGYVLKIRYVRGCFAYGQPDAVLAMQLDVDGSPRHSHWVLTKDVVVEPWNKVRVGQVWQIGTKLQAVTNITALQARFGISDEWMHLNPDGTPACPRIWTLVYCPFEEEA